MAEVLTDQQKRFFDVFGYLVLPGLLADVIDDVTNEAEAVWAMESHDGAARTIAEGFIGRSERLAQLLDDPRIDGVAADLLGDEYNYVQSDATLHTGDTRWHHDGLGYRDLRFLKIAMYLDPVGPDNGALRVVPGSHKVGDEFAEAAVHALLGEPRRDPQLMPDDADGMAEFLAAFVTNRAEREDRRQQERDRALGVSGSDIPAAVLSSEPGDVVVFDYNILHSAWSGSDRRRMLALGFCEHSSDANLPDLRKFIAWNGMFLRERMIDESIVATAGPQRMRHLTQVIANEDVLPGVVQQLRERL